MNLRLVRWPSHPRCCTVASKAHRVISDQGESADVYGEMPTLPETLISCDECVRWSMWCRSFVLEQNRPVSQSQVLLWMPVVFKSDGRACAFVWHFTVVENPTRPCTCVIVQSRQWAQFSQKNMWGSLDNRQFFWDSLNFSLPLCQLWLHHLLTSSCPFSRFSLYLTQKFGRKDFALSMCYHE